MFVKIFLGLVLTTQAFAGNLQLSELAGKYKITHELLPVVNIVTIYEDGKVELVEETSFSNMKCEGEANLEDDVLVSNMTCDNDMDFVQKVDLSEVTNLKEFYAPVYTSLYDREVVMLFKKL